jgi:hypothetical protein
VANPNPAKKFTSETAPRTGGKPGRIFGTTLIRKNIELAASAKGVDAKEFMLGIIGDETLPLEVRQVAARDVIRYTHKAMPQAIEHDVNVRMRKSFAQAVLGGEPQDEEGTPS